MVYFSREKVKQEIYEFPEDRQFLLNIQINI